MSNKEVVLTYTI